MDLTAIVNKVIPKKRSINLSDVADKLESEEISDELIQESAQHYLRIFHETKELTKEQYAILCYAAKVKHLIPKKEFNVVMKRLRSDYPVRMNYF